MYKVRFLGVISGVCNQPIFMGSEFYSSFILLPSNSLLKENLFHQDLHQTKITHTCWIFVHPIEKSPSPDAQCMVYLPTFTPQNYPNEAK